MQKLKWSVKMHIKHILWVADGGFHHEDRLVIHLPSEASNFQQLKSLFSECKDRGPCPELEDKYKHDVS
jgi:hypothetical protein